MNVLYNRKYNKEKNQKNHNYKKKCIFDILP